MPSMTIPSVIRQLLTFGDKSVECSRVSVNDDATYCIEGHVCNAIAVDSLNRVQGVCPVKGDAAVEHCTSESRSFSHGCLAPVDAQCVIRSTSGQWHCVFPDNVADESMTNETDQVQPAPRNELALSASTQEGGTSKTMGVSSFSINIAVGVACCVLAFVGLVLVKKRRNRERLSPYTLSEKDISIVTL